MHANGDVSRTQTADEVQPQVLYVCRHVPYIPSSGAITRSFHLVRAVAEIADVTLVGMPQVRPDTRTNPIRSVCRDLIELDAEPGLPPHALTRLIFGVQALSARHAMARPLGLMLNWLRTSPGGRRLTQHVEQSGVRAVVARSLRQTRFDLVIVEHTEIARKLSDLLEHWGGPRIADFHNVMHVHEERMLRARGEVSGGRRRLTSASPIRADEEQIMRSYTAVTAVSESDAGFLRDLGPARVEVVPNGVDIEYFGAVRNMRAAQGEAESGHCTLIFTGLLSYEPNIDAVTFFIRQIWPLIRNREPRARFFVVGGGPIGHEIEALAQEDGIDVFVSVDDVRPYMVKSSVAVVPLRLGGGTRLKILEALAAQLPVVSTTVGAEGLSLEPDRDLLVADTPADFADAVLQLLREPERACMLALHGQQTVRRTYEWAGITAQFQSLIRGMR